MHIFIIIGLYRFIFNDEFHRDRMKYRLITMVTRQKLLVWSYNSGKYYEDLKFGALKKVSSEF